MMMSFLEHTRRPKICNYFCKRVSLDDGNNLIYLIFFLPNKAGFFEGSILFFLGGGGVGESI